MVKNSETNPINLKPHFKLTYKAELLGVYMHIASAKDYILLHVVPVLSLVYLRNIGPHIPSVKEFL